MLFEGTAITVKLLDNDIAQLNFDLQGESVNKFDIRTVAELDLAITALDNAKALKGLLITSSKSVFIVGADVTEFVPLFSESESVVAAHLQKNIDNFRRLEDLKVPTVVAINGFALGGGLELCLSCDYRVASQTASVGLPETSLGILPGWGGTVRLPRIAGYETAVNWIVSGRGQKMADAQAAGVVDEVVAADELFSAAHAALLKCIDGQLDYQARRRRKKAPLVENVSAVEDEFALSRAQVKKLTGENYPAALIAVDCIQSAATLPRDEAQLLETEAFLKVFATQTAVSLVGLFVSDQLIAKKARGWEKRADKKIAHAAVLGAGIMGGGIAYQSALTGTPIKMKDIAQAGLDLGMSEASKLLGKRVKKGKMNEEQKARILASIEPTLTYDNFDQVDIVVEAVVENPKVKNAVLSEVETQVSGDAVIVSNTSTIRIDYLAQALQRPENFCGMHFFNPVHAMPLVEVIRGEHTSDNTIARTVAYANSLGKKAIVVSDCPGFLVNRTLFPYFAGFSDLVRDGADFQQIDLIMEKWGWPMGPAYLLDVVGIDTCFHAEAVMAEGFPDRMDKSYKTAADVMFEKQRYGQKNGKGFYDYATDDHGRPKKAISPEVYDLIAPFCQPKASFSEEEIIVRTMLPMATEMARCLEEGVVGSPAEADMALVYGLGFPTFRGGIMRWVDSIGLKKLVEYSDQYHHLGKLYQVTDTQREMAASAKTYY